MAEIDKILTLGDDAQSSQFEVYFPEGLYGGDSGEEVGLRIQNSVTIPREVTSEYIVTYRGMTIPFPASVDETDKTLTFDSVRLDGDWEIYKVLRAWQKASFDSSNATRDSVANLRKIIGIRALNQDNVTTFDQRFVGAWLKEIEQTPFDHTGVDPLAVSLTFRYVKKIEE